MAEPPLVAHALVKAYRGRRVLDGVALTVEGGGVTLLAGVNGAGKTTLLRVLATVEAKDGGRLRIGGVDADEDAAAARRRLGYAGHDAGAYPALTVREHLAFHAGFWPDAETRVRDALDAFGLAPRLADERANRLSRGERQRLALARAFLPAPPLLLLDEPWTALDADGRDRLDAAIRDATAAGAGVLASTQEPDAVAARFRGGVSVARVADGRVTREGST